MSFESDVNRFIAKTEQRAKDIFVASTVEVKRSVVEGSSITTSKGQPVDTGALRASWADNFLSATLWQLQTNIAYAPAVENRVMTDRPSEVGGHHSVKLTEAGFSRIVDQVTSRFPDR